MTMFGFFLLPSIFELLYFYGFPGLPPYLDLVMGALAFAVEGLIFVWHLHGRTSLDVQVHTFVVYAIIMCVVSTLLEIFFPDDIRPILLRSGFTLLQGTWFYFVGFILYPPLGWQKWKESDHHEMMMATMMFAWSIAAVVACQFAIAVFAYCWVKRRRRPMRSQDRDNDVDEDMRNLLETT